MCAARRCRLFFDGGNHNDLLTGAVNLISKPAGSGNKTGQGALGIDRATAIEAAIINSYRNLSRNCIHVAEQDDCFLSRTEYPNGVVGIVLIGVKASTFQTQPGTRRVLLRGERGLEFRPFSLTDPVPVHEGFVGLTMSLIKLVLVADPLSFDLCDLLFLNPKRG